MRRGEERRVEERRGENMATKDLLLLLDDYQRETKHFTEACRKLITERL